jgi:hypothetical protein
MPGRTYNPARRVSHSELQGGASLGSRQTLRPESSPFGAPIQTGRPVQGPTPPMWFTRTRVMYPRGGLSIGGNFTLGPM